MKIKNLWNKTLFFQSLIIGFVYQVFLFLGTIYAGLGMSREYANIILAIADIPFILIRFVERMYCYDSACLTQVKDGNVIVVLGVNFIFSSVLFYAIVYASKLKISTIKLLFLSIVFGFLFLVLIDVMINFR